MHCRPLHPSPLADAVVHTEEQPSGAVRGTLERASTPGGGAGTPAPAPAPAPAPTPAVGVVGAWLADLTSAGIRPQAPELAAVTATGTLQVAERTDGTFQWEVLLSEPVQAQGMHIHVGGPEQNGGYAAILWDPAKNKARGEGRPGACTCEWGGRCAGGARLAPGRAAQLLPLSLRPCPADHRGHLARPAPLERHVHGGRLCRSFAQGPGRRRLCPAGQLRRPVCVLGSGRGGRGGPLVAAAYGGGGPDVQVLACRSVVSLAPAEPTPVLQTPWCTQFSCLSAPSAAP